MILGLGFLYCVILRSVVKFARPQQTRGLSESLFCLLAQVFRDIAAAVRDVWGQMAFLAPACSASSPLLDSRASLMAQRLSSAGEGSWRGGSSLCCFAESAISQLPAYPGLRGEKLTLSSCFELPLVSTLHSPRRPEFLLLSTPQPTDPPLRRVAVPLWACVSVAVG